MPANSWQCEKNIAQCEDGIDVRLGEPIVFNTGAAWCGPGEWTQT
ncbi:hypothetical protein PIGHUM_02081 [Pigmentiphaga humi]|uniref:Uncharacterized protein n=1 Tax=Pigmentiphaga humi TaxID=2478468 RepID=A0A3P4B144_9BURK|nr:hypothetical protein PIGHUM_02081 [Pigmentiphaga humi]